MIQHCDLAAANANDGLALKQPESDRNTSTPNAQHDRKKLVRDLKLVAIRALGRHQQPACEPLFKLVACIHQRCLRDLHKEGVAKTKQPQTQRGTLVQAIPQLVDRNAIAGTRRLHVGRVLRPACTHDDRKPGHALSANQANLDAANRRLGNDGRKASRWKIDVFDVPVRNLQLLSQRQIDGSQMRRQQREIIFRDPRKDFVGEGQIELLQCGCSVP